MEMLSDGATAEEVRAAAEVEKEMHQFIFEELGLPLRRSLDESLAPRNERDLELVKKSVLSREMMTKKERSRVNYLMLNFRHWREARLQISCEMFHGGQNLEQGYSSS